MTIVHLARETIGSPLGLGLAEPTELEPEVKAEPLADTVEPPNKGHFGGGDFVLYLEAVLWWEVRITTVSTRVIPIGAIASVLYIEVVLWWEGPL